MGKIYEGDTKLNVLQVCDKLRNEITTEQAKVLAKFHVSTGSAKKEFAHMVLDGYRHMPNNTEHDMLVKKLAKHLMEKYMKSTTTMEGEESAFMILIKDIIEKAGE